MNVILGINNSHNGSVALICDGEVKSAIQAERISRHKRQTLSLGKDMRLIKNCINYCLNTAGFEYSDIEAIALCTPWKLKKIDDLDFEYKKKIFHTFSRIYDTQVGMAETDPFKVNVFKTATFFKKEDKPKKKNTGKIDFEEWNFDRIKKIIDTVPSEPYQLMFKLMAETSCRPSEARAAQRKNFHFKRNIPVFEITNSVDFEKSLVPPKTEAGYRELEISSSLKDQLIDYMNTLPDDQQCIFLNSKSKFHDLKNMITYLDNALESLNLKLPVARKTYFFRHWNVSYWCYQGKYTNPFDLATHMGDLDLKFINTNYIKKYSTSKESVKYSEHQNNHYQWN